MKIFFFPFTNWFLDHAFMDEAIDLLIKLSVCCGVDFINFGCRLLEQIGKKSELCFHNLTFMLEVAKAP
jgi:hypothetical protein